MLEALVVVAATTGLFALALGAKGNLRFEGGRSLLVSMGDDRSDDLPCPWCYAQTDEADNRCGGCGRDFGWPAPSSGRQSRDPTLLLSGE